MGTNIKYLKYLKENQNFNTGRCLLRAKIFSLIESNRLNLKRFRCEKWEN